MAEATDYRGSTYVGSHAIAHAFVAAGAKVFWAGTPLYPYSMLRARSDAATARRIRVWREGGARADGVTEYYPLTFLPVVDRPLLRSRFVAAHTLDATLPRLDSVLREHGFDAPDVAWLSNSRFSHPAGAMVRARIRACRLSDDWAHFGNVPASLLALHDELVDSVDAVFVTSRRLQDKLRDRRPDAVYLPNGVSETFFGEAGPEPALLAPFPRPRVVFVGKLDAWVDFDCIATVGARNPRASVLVVGPGTPARRDYPENVHFLGAVPYAGLPDLLRACDVGIVPFVPGELTHAVSPLKLFEYLATGLAVVATRLDEIEASGTPSILCDDADAFASAVAEVADGDAAGRAERIAFARRHTWPVRFAQVRSVLGI